jgi:hypothetical protein
MDAFTSVSISTIEGVSKGWFIFVSCPLADYNVDQDAEMAWTQGGPSDLILGYYFSFKSICSFKFFELSLNHSLLSRDLSKLTSY